MMPMQGRPVRPVLLAFFAALGVMVTSAKSARSRENTSSDCLVLRFEGAWDPNHSAAIAIDLHTASARRRVQLCPVGIESTGRILVLSAAESTLESVTLSLDTEEGETLTRRISLHEVPADGRVFAIVIAGDELLRASKQQPARVTRKSDSAVLSATPSPSPDAPKPVPMSAAPGPAGARRRPSNSLSLALASEHYEEGQMHLGPDLQWQHSLTSNVFAAVALLGRRGLGVATASGVVEARALGGRAALGYVMFARHGLSLSFDAGARLSRMWFEATAHGGTESRSSSGWLVYTDALASLGLQTRSAFGARIALGVGIPLLSQAAVEGTQPITAAGGLAAEAHTAVLWEF